jgi:hypothetical protein
MKLDAKFYGNIFKIKDNSTVPDDEYVVFLAKDNAFANILPQYLAECIRLGADKEQVEAVTRIMDRLFTWRQAHPDRLKTPDAAGERLLDTMSEPTPESKPLYQLGEFYLASGRELKRLDDTQNYVLVGFLDDRVSKEVIEQLNRNAG